MMFFLILYRAAQELFLLTYDGTKLSPCNCWEAVKEMLPDLQPPKTKYEGDPWAVVLCNPNYEAAPVNRPVPRLLPN